MNSLEDIGAIVADIGSFSSRIGFAGDDCPRACFPTTTGISLDDSGHKSFKFDTVNLQPSMTIESATCEGVVNDWDILENLWEYSIRNVLQVDLMQSPTLVSEKPYNAPSDRHRMVEFMFEKLSVPALYLAKDAALSCYACGKTSGLVVDAGASGTVITPIVDGWAETKGLNRSIVGGRLLDSFILNRLKKLCPDGKPIYMKNLPTKHITISPSYDTLMNLETARHFKESMCRMADSTLVDSDARFTNLPLLPYELPDGTMVDVGIDRFIAPELYIDPNALHNEDVLSSLNMIGQSGKQHDVPSSSLALPNLIRDSVIRCDADAQAMMLANIIVTGGSSSFEGMTERIRTEVEKVVHASAPGWKIKTTGSAQNERSMCTWLGGSILASLGSFHDVWISKQEYDEFGSCIVDRKCS